MKSRLRIFILFDQEDSLPWLNLCLVQKQGRLAVTFYTILFCQRSNLDVVPRLLNHDPAYQTTIVSNGLLDPYH